MDVSTSLKSNDEKRERKTEFETEIGDEFVSTFVSDTSNTRLHRVLQLNLVPNFYTIF